MLNPDERKIEQEIGQLYTWKENYISAIDKIIDMVKKETPNAYANEVFQRSMKELKEQIEEYCVEKEKRIGDLTDYTQKE